MGLQGRRHWRFVLASFSDLILRMLMPELDPATRSRCFNEVNLGLAAPEAVREAMRCLTCANSIHP